MVGFDEFSQQNLSLAQPEPVVLELNRLHNLLKEKDRELGSAQTEIKALKAADVLKEKSLEELQDMVEKQENKIRNTENLLEQKNLEIKKLTTEKKEALAAQFAAEATLRRVHASQKDDDSVPIESIIAPLEADIKMYKSEIAVLQEDKKTLERHSKSKEAALLEAERILRSALERALIVEVIQNQNIELRRQVEICQELTNFLEENKILEKTNRQKVLEVEKLSETIKELEEVVLAGRAAANAIRDYKRQISELQEVKRTLERELGRAKVLANRVATTVSKEWKDENDKVMPVKQWLEERRLLQAEMQRLKDKLTISERTAKSEAQLKEKVRLRLKTLEDGLKRSSYGSPKLEKPSHFFGILSSNGRKKRSTSQPRASTMSSQKSDTVSDTKHGSGELKQINSTNKKYSSGENLMRRSLWASRIKVVDGDEKENNELILENTTRMDLDTFKDNDDVVSGFLYDRLQKEVIDLRKFCEMKDSNLKAKDEDNKVLMKKVENLVKAQAVESKKWKSEAAIREKHSASVKTDEQKPVRNFNSSKSFSAVKAS